MVSKTVDGMYVLSRATHTCHPSPALEQLRIATREERAKARRMAATTGYAGVENTPSIHEINANAS
jgi:hypothetical protein